jgi:transcriptional regulator PpsR
MRPSPPAVMDLGALAGLAPELANTFASLASDIALVIDADGVIRNAALGDAPIGRRAEQWIGNAFVDTVTQDTRGKIESLLREVQDTGVSRRREVNLAGAGDTPIPVVFAAIRLGRDGPVLAVGRDLRAIAAIQQRYLDAQQELERDYWKQRQAESRYRQLFQVATDAVLVVDAATLLVIEANRAAADLFGTTPGELAGRPMALAIDPASRPAVEELLVAARASGKPAEIRARLAAAPGMAALSLIDVSATPFRASAEQGSQLLLLVRARGADRRSGDALRRLADFVESTPDAVVITDSGGRVQTANPAFLALCQPGLQESQVSGRSLIDLLGDPGHQLSALIADVRRQGIAAQVRAVIGTPRAAWVVPQDTTVEVSAALLAEGDQECIGFILRRHAARPDRPLQPLRPVDGLAAAIETLAAQLGRVSLPELMQEATHLAEHHLIRNALERANGQLHAAADWLGITPESLALRLARHGLVADGGAPPLLN